MEHFALARPTALDAAILRLPKGLEPADYDSVKLLAGGQDLITELKDRLVTPSEVVDLKRIPGLDEVQTGTDGGHSIGALVTLDRLEEHDFGASYAALNQAAASVASPQIRSQGTLGGNLNQRPRCWYYRHGQAPCLKKGGTECYSYAGENRYNAILGGGPSYIVHPSDLAPVLVALEASAQVVSMEGPREVLMGDYFTLPTEGEITRETVLTPGEILTQVHIPALPPGVKSTYLKFKERSSYDFALSAVALVLGVGAENRIEAIRLVLGGVAPVPWRCERTEALVLGKQNTPETWRLAAEDALLEAEPLSQNGYKVPLTQGLIRRAFQALS